MYQRKSILPLLLLFLVLSVSQPLWGGPLGQITARLIDEQGQPLGHALVKLLEKAASPSLPILARTNGAGVVSLRGLEAGAYEMIVRSARHRVVSNLLVQIRPGETAFQTLIFKHLFDLEGAADNVSIKTLLRADSGRRLIFRGLPRLSPIESKRLIPFDQAVFQMYSSAGLGSDYVSIPGDSADGGLSNFAVVNKLGLNRYILAGQIQSGANPHWRLRNRFDYELNESHQLQLTLGYGRFNLEKPNPGVLGNPLVLANDPNYTRSLGSAQNMNLGLVDRYQLGKRTSLSWGVDIDRVKANQYTTSLLNPHLEATILPTDSTRVRLLVTSRRESQANGIDLFETGRFSLANTANVARYEDQFQIGSSRYSLVSLNQELGFDLDLELAAFRNQLFSAAHPLVGVAKNGSDLRAFQLAPGESDNQGYRVSLRRLIAANVSAELSLVLAEAAALPGPGNHLNTLPESGTVPLAGLQRQLYQIVTTEVDAFIPASQTHLSAIVKFSPGAQGALVTLDTFNDYLDTSNEGVNLFVRQTLPMPAGLLNFFGLHFISPQQIEALVDIRNLTNETVGTLNTAMGEFVLARNPRVLRGGISVKF